MLGFSTFLFFIILVFLFATHNVTNRLPPVLVQNYEFPVILTTADFETSIPPRPLVNKSLQQSIRTQTHVSTILATHLLSNQFADSNFVFSPVSLHVIMSLLAAGSNGQTQDQILSFLKTDTTDELNSLYTQLVPWIFADGSASDGPEMSFVDGVWVDESLTLKPFFKHVVETVYKAACKKVDFKNKAIEVASELNLWGEKQTRGLIKQFLPNNAFDDSTQLVLANAIYYKGVWSQKFYKERTRQFDFHLLNGNNVTVPFMTSMKKQFVRQYDDFTVLALPYAQGQDKREFKMYIFLPYAKDGLQSLVKKTCSTDFFGRHIPHLEVAVGRFFIPKFKISSEFKASDMLQKLELVLPFNQGNADFTNIVNLPLFVYAIHHKSFMEVNEEGTEASAFSIASYAKGIPEGKVDFVADHPFLFMIREDLSGTVLFIGQVTNPHVG